MTKLLLRRAGGCNLSSGGGADGDGGVVRMPGVH